MRQPEQTRHARVHPLPEARRLKPAARSPKPVFRGYDKSTAPPSAPRPYTSDPDERPLPLYRQLGAIDSGGSDSKQPAAGAGPISRLARAASRGTVNPLVLAVLHEHRINPRSRRSVPASTPDLARRCLELAKELSRPTSASRQSGGTRSECASPRQGILTRRRWSTTE